MLPFLAAATGLALASRVPTTNAFARPSAARLQSIQSHLLFLDAQQVRNFVNHAAVFRRINHLNGLVHSS
jgi:hypothetical protein